MGVVETRIYSEVRAGVSMECENAQVCRRRIGRGEKCGAIRDVLANKVEYYCLECIQAMRSLAVRPRNLPPAEGAPPEPRPAEVGSWLKANRDRLRLR